MFETLKKDKTKNTKKQQQKTHTHTKKTEVHGGRWNEYSVVQKSESSENAFILHSFLNLYSFRYK